MPNNNLWAPWRISYLKDLGDKEADGQDVTKKETCFLCDYLARPAADGDNLLLYRGRRNFVVMNGYPYSAGHLLIAPHDHVPDLDCLDDDAMLEMMKLTRDYQKIIARTIRPHGFNIGFNIGRCAGAGLPGHVHLHIIPRWDGDTNMLTTVGNTRVISQSLSELYNELLESAKILNLPEPV